jgi:ribonuclease HII
MTPAVTVGVDEAGRGAVLGPMVVAAVRCGVRQLPTGVDDSKRLAVMTRRRIGLELAATAPIEIAYSRVEPAMIDDPRADLTSLTVTAARRALRRLLRPGDRVLLDAADVDAARFGRRVARGLAVPELTVEAQHRADEEIPQVAAASVAAKVLRDAAIATIDTRWAERGGVGSGYPSDPTTRAFIRHRLAEGGPLPDVVRTSWSTVAQLQAELDQQTLS